MYYTSHTYSPFPETLLFTECMRHTKSRLNIDGLNLFKQIKKNRFFKNFDCITMKYLNDTLREE